MCFFKKIKSCTKVGKAIQGHPDGLHAPAGRPPRSPRALGHHPAASRAQRRPTGAQWHQDRRSDRDCMYRGRRSLLGLVIQPQDPVLVVSGVRADFGNPISKQWFSELCGATAGDIFRHPKRQESCPSARDWSGGRLDSAGRPSGPPLVAFPTFVQEIQDSDLFKKRHDYMLSIARE